MLPVVRSAKRCLSPFAVAALARARSDGEDPAINEALRQLGRASFCAAAKPPLPRAPGALTPRMDAGYCWTPSDT